MRFRPNCGQLDQSRTAAARKAKELLAIDEPRALGPEWGARERPTTVATSSRQAGAMRDQGQIAFFLAHGALADDLAADDHVGAMRRASTRRDAEHIDPAIDARIRPAAVTVTRVADQVEIIVLLADDREPHAQFVGGLGRLVLTAGERGAEVEGLDLDPESLQDANGEHAIQPPGK